MFRHRPQPVEHIGPDESMPVSSIHQLSPSKQLPSLLSDVNFVKLKPFLSNECDFSLRLLYTNATSLSNKWDEFISLIQYSHFPHILLITETWFNIKSITSVDNYSLFFKNREQIKGGGVAVYVRNDIESFEIIEKGFDNLQSEQI
jgi:hypothetical protein